RTAGTGGLACEIDMTDAFDRAGEDFSPADSLSNNDAFTEVSSAPEAVEEFAPNGFLKLNLAPELMAAINDLGFTQPTAVQEQVIPLALQGQGADDAGQGAIDLMVSSQTGSGKTAAFLLPVL